MKKNKWWPLTNKEYCAIIKRVNEGDVEDEYGGPDAGVVPKDEIDAVKLTIAKWHPNRGANVGESKECWASDSCGCCGYYGSCDECILSRDIVGSIGCCGEGIAFKYACKRLEELNA